MAMGEAVVFLHAHPDDEAIFTGGTIALLAGRGVRAIVVVATGDETRRAEAAAACAVLGADVEFLGFSDWGHAGTPDAPRLVDAVLDDAAGRLADVVRAHGATSLVVYDEGGIYGHPDHLAVHRVGVRATELAGIDTVYEATVDREYLHFVETHLVAHALDWLLDGEVGPAINRAPLGVPTVLVSTMVDVTAVLHLKRQALAAHASQIAADAPVRSMDDATFAAVYGYEWYVRRGPAGPLDALG